MKIAELNVIILEEGGFPLREGVQCGQSSQGQVVSSEGGGVLYVEYLDSLFTVVRGRGGRRKRRLPLSTRHEAGKSTKALRFSIRLLRA